ncbi:MAG TPA: hypothetical protein VGM63_06415 [Mucilaginibacter sp.]|jgi:hypothetical protein
MKDSDGQKSPWKTAVLIPAVAIIVTGIATAISEDLRTSIKNLFSGKHADTTKLLPVDTSRNTPVNKKITFEVLLTNKAAALRGDTVIFDNGEIIYTDDAGKCYVQVYAGTHSFKVHAFNSIFNYAFYAPNKPDSLYTLSEDINYTPPPSVVVAPPDTSKKSTVTNNPILTAAAIQARRLPSARMQLQVKRLATVKQ